MEGNSTIFERSFFFFVLFFFPLSELVLDISGFCFGCVCAQFLMEYYFGSSLVTFQPSASSFFFFFLLDCSDAIQNLFLRV